MIKPGTKRNFRRILPFGLIWLFFALVYAILERGLLGDVDTYPATGNPYEFQNSLFYLSAISFLLGILMGCVEIFYLDKRFSRMSLYQKIIVKLVFYFSVVIFSLAITTLIMTAVRLDKNLFDQEVFEQLVIFMGNFAFLGVSVFMAMVIGVSLFFSEVSENLGQGVLQNFFTGKYHKPRIETRIFMFLDMKSSTRIAEQLGHVRYFEMLQEYYNDISEPIVDYKGEVYQYVGDEIVISWSRKKGIAENNCIHCYFAMKRSLHEKSPKYRKKYGLVPEFKAGLHFGEVTAGEIGRLKKEIIYTGDVMNTTARIQSLCNELNSELLVSEKLIQQLPNDETIQYTSAGNRSLRGKLEDVNLLSVSMTQSSV